MTNCNPRNPRVEGVTSPMRQEIIRKSLIPTLVSAALRDLRRALVVTFEAWRTPLKILPDKDTLPVEGLRIGTAEDGDKPRPVCIPEELCMRSAFYVGRPGMGTSTLLENHIMQDLREVRKVVVLDPHGELVERLLA